MKLILLGKHLYHLCSSVCFVNVNMVLKCNVGMKVHKKLYDFLDIAFEQCSKSRNNGIQSY